LNTTLEATPTTETMEQAMQNAYDNWDHSERCDSCGHRAYVKTLHNHGTMSWCKHHAETTGVMDKAKVLADIRHTLYSQNKLKD